MKPRITIITLGVDDLEKLLTFYRDGLGLPTQGIVGKEFERGTHCIGPAHSCLNWLASY
jgi:catechol 2,3-dioxygenase-like lactoylglutathione lyase family enzyme